MNRISGGGKAFSPNGSRFALGRDDSGAYAFAATASR
jgi:hypothetical protein